MHDGLVEAAKLLLSNSGSLMAGNLEAVLVFNKAAQARFEMMCTEVGGNALGKIREKPLSVM